MSETLAPSSEPANRKGKPPLPVGAEVLGHAGISGEASPKTLANRASGTSLDAIAGSLDGARKKRGKRVLPEGTIEIQRSTCRLLVEPWRIAQEPAAHAARKCGGPGKCKACSLIRDLSRKRDSAVFGVNAVIRKMWQEDGDKLEALRVEGKVTNRENWPMPSINAYAIVRRVSPDLSGATASVLSRTAWSKWQKMRFDALVKQECSPPHFSRTMPLPLRAAELRFSRIDGEKDFFVFGFSLDPGRHGGPQYSLPILARDDHQKSILGELADGKVRIGNAAVEQDRKRPSKWYLRISYTRLVDKTKASPVVVGINRGLGCFLAAACSDGTTWVYDGAAIAAYLKQIQRRRKEIQRDVKASARIGHGRTRTLRPIAHLEAKAERWRESRCQVFARRFALWCASRKAGKVYVEDLTGIRDSGGPSELSEYARELISQQVQEWPYYQLQTRIVACLAELGIPATKVSCERDLQNPKTLAWTCPECNSDKVKVDFPKRTMSCEKCQRRWHLDVATAINVYRRGERLSNEPKGSDGGGGSGRGKLGGARKTGGKPSKQGESCGVL